MEAPKPWDASFLLTMEPYPLRTPGRRREHTACLALGSKFWGNFAAPVWRSAIIEHPEASETEERLVLLRHISSLPALLHCTFHRGFSPGFPVEVPALPTWNNSNLPSGLSSRHPESPVTGN